MVTRRDVLRGAGLLAGSAPLARMTIAAQAESQPTPQPGSAQGTYLMTSGGDRIEAEFRTLLRALPRRRLVFIPTAASSLRSKYWTIWDPDKDENRDRFRNELFLRFDTTDVTFLHTRSKEVAARKDFLAPLADADAVWMSGGNAGRLAAAYLDTPLVDALRAVVARGGIVAGESAGAIIQGSYVVRGNPDKPVLMVNGAERGFGLVAGIAVNPHLSSTKRENELVSVIDRHPTLLGLGVDDDTALLVRGRQAEVVGSGRVAVYENAKHEDGWYRWIQAGDVLDLDTRQVRRAQRTSA